MKKVNAKGEEEEIVETFGVERRGKRGDRREKGEGGRSGRKGQTGEGDKVTRGVRDRGG